jgi:hypothetical protein
MLTIGGQRMPLARWPNQDAPNTQMKVNNHMKRLGLDRSDFVGFIALSRVIDKGIGKMSYPKNTVKVNGVNCRSL